MVDHDPGTPLAQARRARSQWRWVRARAIAEKALDSAGPEGAFRFQFLAAVAAHALGDVRPAQKLMAPVARGASPLARHAKLKLAEWIVRRAPDEALNLLDELLSELSRTSTPWPHMRKVQRLRASALKRLNRLEEAIDLLRTLRRTEAQPEVELELAMLLAWQPATRLRQESLTLLRQLSHRFPTRRVGRVAEKLAESVLSHLPPRLRGEIGPPGLQLRVQRAQALLDAFAFFQAREAFAELLPETRAEPDLHCQVRFGHAKALIKAKRAARGAQLMARVAQDCTGDPDRRAWARYYAGKALSDRGRKADALAQYEALERESGGHSLADDALWLAAMTARKMKDEAGARQRLELLPVRYPTGDMGKRAAFDLAWQARREGDFEVALSHFDRLMALKGRAPREGAHGRAAYWRARTLLQLGRAGDAVEAYAKLVERWPLTFYGQQALARLSEVDPQRAAQLQVQWQARPPAPLTFAWRPSLASSDFQRSIELVRVGEFKAARREWEALGLLGTNADDLRTRWLCAALLDRVGAHHAAVSLLRGRATEELLHHWPRERKLSLWRIAYPLAFSPLIEETAERFGVPASFVRAVAREESSFNPSAVSPAKAHGLLQLILPTATAVAKGLGLEVDPRTLHRPEINLPVGTRFISALAGRYRGQYSLVPAAYNAGPTVTGRWLQARGDQDLDEWIENIPYEETRRYTRRVLQSFGIYSWLSTGTLPRSSLELPKL